MKDKIKAKIQELAEEVVMIKNAYIDIDTLKIKPYFKVKNPKLDYEKVKNYEMFIQFLKELANEN